MKIRDSFQKRLVSRCLMIAMSLALAAARLHGSGKPTRVDFQCKVVPIPGERGPGIDRWVVRLIGIRGETAGMAVGLDDQTVRFKDLDPGIYTVCVTGSLNRKHCESLDLYPPIGHKSHKFFRKELQAPRSVFNQKDLNRVSRAELVVPKEARDEFLKAEIAEMRHERKNEMQHLKTAIDIYPTYSDALNNYGALLLRSGNVGRAIECFMKVTQQNPNFYGGWTNLSESLILLSKFEEALDAATIAYGLRPNEPLVLSNLARCLYYLHRYSESRKYFERLAELDPENRAYPQLFLGDIESIEGNVDATKKYYEAFLQLHPNAPEASDFRKLVKNLISSRTDDSIGVAESQYHPSPGNP